MRKAKKLSGAERSELQILHERGYSARAIASVLGRSPNTIAAELKRNSFREDGRTSQSKQGTYSADYAKHIAYIRRKYATYQGKKIQENDELCSFIVRKLAEHWNPAEIAGYTKVHPELGFQVSKTAIYEWLYSAWGQQHCQHLYSHRYRRKPRRQLSPARTMIPDRTSVDERPLAAQNRMEVGHWEYDSVVSSKHSGSTAALAVAIERTTRLVTASLVPNLRPAPFAATIARQVANKQVVTLTTDNGIENRHHGLITKKTGAPVFFTDPYSSWQKGSVENANRMLRRYFPKGTDFSTITQTDVVHALTRINNKPRKILGYKSSLQVAREKGVILERVS
jgi:IS30 family transposase